MGGRFSLQKNWCLSKKCLFLILKHSGPQVEWPCTQASSARCDCAATWSCSPQSAVMQAPLTGSCCLSAEPCRPARHAGAGAVNLQQATKGLAPLVQNHVFMALVKSISLQLCQCLRLRMLLLLIHTTLPPFPAPNPQKDAFSGYVHPEPEALELSNAFRAGLLATS